MEIYAKVKETKLLEQKIVIKVLEEVEAAEEESFEKTAECATRFDKPIKELEQTIQGKAKDGQVKVVSTSYAVREVDPVKEILNLMFSIVGKRG